LAADLLDASTLCAIATVDGRGRAHINTAYFAWSRELDLVWLSEPHARHSKNLSASDSAAVAVFDSTQTWGHPDRGIQLFGRAQVVEGIAAEAARSVYAMRFPRFESAGLDAYRLYRFRADRLKLFDEKVLGGGTFVTARLDRERQPVWEKTEVYDPET
jgi:uncharacterized protein YhbP (UPF0306 family)